MRVMTVRLGRRGVLGLAALAAASLAVAPAASAETTLKVALHSDLKIIDPVWTTALISTHHGMMVYDTLFALDEKLQVKPQMVDKWSVSDDKLTWTFTLARRARVARRPAGDRRGLHRLAQALERPRRHGPEAHELRRRAEADRRQDLRHEAEGALRPRARHARQVDLQLSVHDAQARRRDRSQHADHGRHRLRPVHLQEGRVEARREGGLSQEHEIQAARRAVLGLCRRQGGQGRPGGMDLDRRPADAGQRAAQRRDRLHRGAAARSDPAAGQGPQHQDAGRRPHGAPVRVPLQRAAQALRQRQGAPGRGLRSQPEGLPELDHRRCRSTT